jgi:hypothetical protein
MTMVEQNSSRALIPFLPIPLAELLPYIGWVKNAPGNPNQLFKQANAHALVRHNPPVLNDEPFIIEEHQIIIYLGNFLL